MSYHFRRDLKGDEASKILRKLQFRPDRHIQNSHGSQIYSGSLVTSRVTCYQLQQTWSNKGHHPK
jgi:hypothetical protein